MSTSLTAAKQLAVLAINFDAMHTESASPPGKNQLCLQWPFSVLRVVLHFSAQLLQSRLLLLPSLVHISF
jgi:hypothetical protein